MHSLDASGVGDVFHNGRPLTQPDARQASTVDRELAERFGIASALFVPLVFDRRVTAVVTLMSRAPRDFGQQDIALAHTLCNQASAALAGLEMRHRLGVHAERQTALARAANALNARLDVHSVLHTLCKEADLALGGDCAGVYLGNADTGGLPVAADGVPDGADWYTTVIQPGEGVAGRVLLTGKPAKSNDYPSDQRGARIHNMVGVESAVSVPVSWNGALKGALSVAFRSERLVDEDDIGTLQAIADLAAIACSNAEAFENAQHAARSDSLTGLLNHGALQVRLVDEIQRVRRTGTPLCCLLLDLDNFKPINDQHGHLVGDQVLRHVAAAIGREFRSYDGLARFGGDEFVLVLPDTDEEAAIAAARRLQEVVTSGAREMGEHGVELTTSVGVAPWREPLTAGELLDRADRALLVAKRRGRNLSVLASQKTEEELAHLEAAAGTSPRLVSELWDLVSQCERPDQVLDRLPGFMRGALALEEAAIYRTEPGGGGALKLVTHTPEGDSESSAFRDGRLDLSEDRIAALGTGGISRASFGELLSALGAAPGRAPTFAVGACAATTLARDGEVYGLLLLRTSAGQFPLPLVRLAELLTAQAVTALLGQSGGASRSAVGALAAAIDARDNYTHSHSEQVVTLALETARLLGLPPAELEGVRDGALLHDVGKVAIPNEILYKPGPLTDGEWRVMREHPAIGEQILRRTPELESIAALVRHEHERWDGDGYPDRLQGTAIPIASRIIFACDAYSAMITARPYREPMSEVAAIEELRKGAGTQFDPTVVTALLEALSARATALREHAEIAPPSAPARSSR